MDAGLPEHRLDEVMPEMAFDNGSNPEIVAYTDGACRGNPGPGGYGVVLIGGAIRKELSGGYRLTTNNRMELLAAIKALQVMTQRCAVTLYTDSEYVARGISEGWALRWREKGWRISANKPAKNPDLWAELLDQAAKHAVSVRWVRGHGDVPENNRADQLAVATAAAPDLPPDEGYERQQSEPPEPTIREGHPCFKCKTPVLKRTPQRH
ncbi:MAG: ribonuclease HI, partial [Verrucomicrobia bacterium A1]